MSLAVIAFAFGLGLLLGALSAVLMRMKVPDMAPAKRRFRSALPGPVVVLAVCILGAIGIVANGWQELDDLALATLAGVAIVGGGVALLGGLIGAALIERRAAR